MSISLLIAAVAAAAVMSLLFSTLTYSLRELSRAKLEVELEKRGTAQYFDPTIEHLSDLTVATAVGRLLSNILILIGVLAVLSTTDHTLGTQYLLAVVISAVLHLFFSVTIPHAISRHAAEDAILTALGFGPVFAIGTGEKAR